MLQVYLDPCTINSRKVLAGLDLMGTKFELKHIDYFTGEHKSPEYLKILLVENFRPDLIKNPNGTVPSASDGPDFNIKEPNAKPLTDQNDTTKQAPVMLAHCDYTAESGPIRVRQLLWDEAGDLLSRRVACFNSIHLALSKRPLAMRDVTSAPADDLFNLHLRYCDPNGENYVMRYSPTHQCWYFPNMEADQVILLKTYESRSDVARFIGYTAFENPMSPPDAKIHESVEIRTIAFL
ncbi:uncharacterized protein RAG0_09781 [Rhynchosporium agropyri]|uniref:Uncharacterized protein n=1 Tax=Rhynchosporium agropyri TaxID=914238 RepID=A0A1E1KWZ8_9HELO|nr:uncharacterized protein RAG0_09781 [Rhynchosporium agropyri]